jgi:hypothetical protein
MQVIAEVSKPVDITYRAAKHTSGLTDVTMQIYDESRALDAINFPDVVMTEIGSTGIYYGSFTPDAKGTWTVMIDSATKSGPDEQTIIVGDYDLDSLGATVDNIKTTVDDLSDPPAIV